MGRIDRVDGLLLLTVTIWSVNYSASKYALTNGFHPLAFSSLRYGIGMLLFAGFAFLRERSLRITRRDLLLLVLPAAAAFLVNQLSFIYALKLTSASTVALILGTVPVFTGLAAWFAGIERPSRPFWIAAALSFGGVALVAAGSGGVSGNIGGDLLAILMSASWAVYSVLIVPLMRRYSPFRISAVVMLTMGICVLVIASGQLSRQSFSLSGLTWLAFAYSIAGPVLVGQLLWFVGVDHAGPGRASLLANLQPFGGALFAILLLSEHLTRLEVAGGVLIGLGIVAERIRRPTVVVQPPAE